MRSRDRDFHGIHAGVVERAHAASSRASGIRDEGALAALDVYGSLVEKHHRLTAGSVRALYADIARRRELVIGDLSTFERRASRIGGVNPFDWSDGHVGHFYEWMSARALTTEVDDECAKIGAACDVHALFDSFRADHADRWRAEAVIGRDPTGKECERYRDAAAAWCERLLGEDDDRLMGAVETYLHLYGVLHEHWHVEDYVQARNTLKYSPPGRKVKDSSEAAATSFPADCFGGTYVVKGKAHLEMKCSSEVITTAGYAIVDVGKYRIGAEKDDKWVFDAERWAHDVSVVKFAIAKTCCTNAQFAAFIEAGGYDNRTLWSHEGWRWLSKRKTSNEGLRLGPLGWIPFQIAEVLAGGDAPSHTAWHSAQFNDEPRPLWPQLPVCHVTWYEAEAYCNWIGARLPTEVEWEVAARTTLGYVIGDKRRTYPWGEAGPSVRNVNLDIHRGGTVDVNTMAEGESAYGCRHMIGNVWEWTATSFLPFPGFQMDFPYRENSCPWFGYRKVVKGGCWATSAPIARAGYRHSFWPDMHHTFSGFRVAIGGDDGLRKRALLVVPQNRHAAAKCGNIVTMERIAAHLQANGMDAFMRSIGELPRSSQDMANIIIAMNVDLIIVLHAFKCGAVIDVVGQYKDLLPPLVLILGGTDVNVDAKFSTEAESIFRKRVDIATKVVSFSLSMIDAAPKGSLQFVEKDITAKCQLVPQGVSTPIVSKHLAKRKHGTSELHNAIGADDDIPIMFLPGGLRPVKDVCYITTALRAYNLHGIRAQLTVCGPEIDATYASKVRHEFNENGDRDRVLLPGVERELVLRYIADAKVLLNTSVSEGQSGTIAEAMMLGTLVFARDIPGNRNLFDLCEARANATLGPSPEMPLKGDGWELHGVGVLFSTPDGCLRAFETLGLNRGASEHAAVKTTKMRAREGIETLSENESERWTEILEIL